MKSIIVYKKVDSKYNSGNILFEAKDKFLEKVTDIPLSLLSLTLEDNFRDYLIDILRSSDSIGGATDALDIDFYDEYAYIIDEVWYSFADRIPEKLKIKKNDLLNFFNVWRELQNKNTAEIILEREDNKLIIKGDEICYFANFEITESQNQFLFSFTKSNDNNYQISKEGCQVCIGNNYIVLDIVSNLLQKENINQVKQAIKNNQDYQGKQIKLTLDSKDGWIKINSINHKEKTLSIDHSKFDAFIDFWNWSVAIGNEKTDKINLMIEDYLLTLYSNYLSISVGFKLEENKDQK